MLVSQFAGQKLLRSAIFLQNRGLILRRASNFTVARSRRFV